MNELRMNRTDLLEFSRTHQRMMMFIHISCSDYVAARCCFLNGLIDHGFILGEQAIEKLLKAVLLFYNPLEKVSRFRNHQLIPIMNQIQTYSDIGLNDYQPFAQKLSDLYDHCRYPDSGYHADNITMNSREVNQLDQFYFFIMENFQLPDEVKYRTGLYVQLGDTSTDLQFNPKKLWAITQNSAFYNLNTEIESKYIMVFNHLYPG